MNWRAQVTGNTAAAAANQKNQDKKEKEFRAKELLPTEDNIWSNSLFLNLMVRNRDIGLMGKDYQL